jgi:hypothetical protein
MTPAEIHDYQNALMYRKCPREHRRIDADGHRCVSVWSEECGIRWIDLEMLPAGEERNKLLWWYRTN